MQEMTRSSLFREFADEQGNRMFAFSELTLCVGRNIGLAPGKSALRAISEFSCHGGRAGKVAFSLGKAT
jgi:hypothetical protein